jgi:hypothetical protein
LAHPQIAQQLTRSRRAPPAARAAGSRDAWAAEQSASAKMTQAELLRRKAAEAIAAQAQLMQACARAMRRHTRAHNNSQRARRP